MGRVNFWKSLLIITAMLALFGTVPERASKGAVRLPDAASSKTGGTGVVAPAALLSGVIAAPVPPRLFLPAEDGPDLGEELQCLALNIYWEARSESWKGQVAVAMVTLNRVSNPRFPGTVCDVVRQGGERTKFRCQFTWYCDGKRDIPQNPVAWRRAQEVAYAVLFLGSQDPTHGALFYHADYVNPSWSRVMTPTTQIGRHVYYGAS